MFRALFHDARTWRYVVDAISTLVDEGLFKATEEGLRLRAMDPSHVAMIDFHMPRDAFDEYECEGEAKIGVNFDEMKKIMRRGRSGDSLELIHDAEKKRLILRFRGKSIRTFSIPLLELEEEELPEPTIEFKGLAIVTAKALNEAIKDIAITSDYVKIQMTPDALVLTASGESGEVKVEFNRESEALLDLDVSEEISATYTLSYLQDVLKVVGAADTVKLQFSTNMPIRLDFNLPGGGRFTYFLAPRIETE